MKKSISVNAAGVAVSLFLLLGYIFLVYGLKSPTPRKMDALILGIVAASAFGLILTEIFPRAYILNLAVAITSGLLVLLGLVSLFTLNGRVAAKASGPYWLGIDSQWLAVSFFFGLFFALPVGVLAFVAFLRDKSWALAHPVPKRTRKTASSPNPATT